MANGLHNSLAVSLRLVIMGTGPFAVPMFEALVQSRHQILTVVTRPDQAPPGRRPHTNPMRVAANAARIPVFDPARVNDPHSVTSLRALAPDLFVVCDYGQIFSSELLSVARWGGVNLHGSLLPRHRGASPVQWAILQGDCVSGVSVIHMTASLDAGAVIVSRETPIGPRETSPELEQRLSEIGAVAVLEAIDRLQSETSNAPLSCDTIIGKRQDSSLATRAPRLTKADGIVTWSLSAVHIERLRRALEPWPRISTFLRQSGKAVPQRLVLEDVAVIDSNAVFLSDANANAGDGAGTILRADEAGIVVACGEGTVLVIQRLVPEGRRSMSAGEFLRGTPLCPGVVLG